MDSRVYDLEVQCPDGTWMTFESIEGLEDAKAYAENERDEMRRGEMPKAPIRIVRQRQ